MELLELLQVLLLQWSGLSVEEQSEDGNRLVDQEFGGLAEVFVLKDSFIKFVSQKQCVCSSDSVVNVFLGGAVR